MESGPRRNTRRGLAIDATEVRQFQSRADRRKNHWLSRPALKTRRWRDYVAIGAAGSASATGGGRDRPCWTAEVPVGTVLRLGSGEWSHCRNLSPNTPVDVVVARVHLDRLHVRSDEVWVTGHAPECAWESSDCMVPCIELLVRVTAIVRQVAAR
jgi:hypothetical protein